VSLTSALKAFTVKALRCSRLAIAAVAISGFTLIASPLLLVAVSALPLNWSRLSEIGQSYTGISAVLSAVALIGVALSFRLQSRQVDIARAQAVRDMQFGLLRLAMDDSTLASVLTTSAGTADTSFDEFRKGAYRNQWFQYFAFGYCSRDISRSNLHNALIYNFFPVEANRLWWIRVRHLWLTEAAHQSKIYREFIEVVEQAFQEVSNKTAREGGDPSEVARS
jgi:hypothetical protein